jgi:hypothetical protein
MKFVSPAQLRRFNHAFRPSILEPSKQRIAEELVPLQVTAVVSCPCRRALNSKVKIFDSVQIYVQRSLLSVHLRKRLLQRRRRYRDQCLPAALAQLTKVLQRPWCKDKDFPRKYVDAADA